MKLPKDLISQTYTKPRLFLCQTDKTRMCQLETIEMSGSFKFNAYSELTFSVGRTYTNMNTGETQVNPFYDKIEALRLVYLEGFGYFEIQDPEITSDGIKEVKDVTAYSLEYTLSQKYLEELKVNTGETDSMEVVYAEANGVSVKPITLLNENPELSLLHLVLEKIPGWKIGDVDPSLQTMSRTFEISRASVYDFIIQDICDQFNCFAVFDTVNNKINLYAEALVTKHIADGKTTVFNVSSPYNEIGSVSIDSYKTTDYTYEVVENSIGIKTGRVIFNKAPAEGAKIEITDGSQTKWMTDVYVTFDNLAQEVNVSYSADDIKTVLTVKGADNLDIREVNTGLPYIVDISYYYNVDWMGQDLFDAYTTYLAKINGKQEEYSQNSEEILKLQNDISFIENRTSLGYGIDSSVNSETVGTYYVVNGGSYPNYTYEEKSLPADYDANETYYKLNGANVTEDKVHTLYSAVRKYFVAVHGKVEPEIEDIATRDGTWEELLEELEDQFAFVSTDFDEFKSALTPNASVSSVKNAFKKFLIIIFQEMGRTPLKDLFLKPYAEIEAIHIKSLFHQEDSDNYWFYYPVTIMIESLNYVISERDKEIDAINEELKIVQKKNTEIADQLSIYNNFNNKQIIRLSSFLREDEYTDDNFIETELDTIETIMKTKQELLECGRIELSKLCEPKLAFSMDMANIYAMPEFEPIIDQFQLGNLITVAIRSDYVKRARLLAVDINFDDFSDFSCEFGELTSLRTPSSIHADLLATALSAGKSVASNASYWNKGVDTATKTDLKIQQGLLSMTNGLYTSDQSLVIDNNGILLRKVNENGEFSPHQAWLRNNTIVLSTDGFKTSRTGLGEFTIGDRTFYGILAEAVLSGYIEGSTIVGGTIDIGDGTFVVESDGSVTMKASSIDGYVEENNVISSINQSPEKIAINANKISLAGKQINLTSDNITIDSTNFSVTKDGKISAKNADIEGKITSSSGTIGGWDIYENLLRKETVVDNVSYQMYMQASDGVSTTNAFAVRKKNPDVSSWDVQFSVTYAGKMTAKNANVTGTITAKDGSIAGYNIGPGGCYDNAIYKRVAGDGSGVDYEVGLKATSGDTDLAFYVKQSADGWTSNSNVFYVRNNGKLYAKNAEVAGKITASSGAIGSWTIGDMGNYTDSLYSTFCAASTPSSNNPEYAVFMRGKGSSESNIAIGVKKRTSSSTSWGDAEETFYVLKNGHVKMTDADVTGKINASSGAISGNLNISGGLINTQGDYTVTLRGVQSDVGKGVFYITDNSSGSAEYPVRINGDGSARFTNVTITGSSTIASACIPNLNADKITAGTLDVGRIPNISASKITSGTISTDRLSSSVITTSNFSSKTLTTGNLSVTNGGNIGIWTVNSNNYLYAISGSYGVSLSATSVSHGQGGSTTWVNIVKAGQNASDKRLKKNISEFDNTLDGIFDSLKPVQFEYSKDFLGHGVHFGYIAQDVVKSFEDAGKNIDNYSFIYETEIEDNSEDKYYQLNQVDFIALNTWQIQKLKTRIEELENKLAVLET